MSEKDKENPSDGKTNGVVLSTYGVFSAFEGFAAAIAAANLGDEKAVNWAADPIARTVIFSAPPEAS